MTKRPHILFLIADDHRHDAIKAIGDPVVQTPVLDSLIRQGTAFRQAHTMGGLTGAVCVPSRACVHTGVHTFRAVRSRQVDDLGLLTLDPSLPTLAQTLQEAGYRTFATGKWHNDHASFTKSFQDGAKLFFGGMSDHWAVPTHDFDPAGHYSQDKIYSGESFSSVLFSDAAIRFIETYEETYEADDPFFLYVAFTAPHDPRTPPPDFAALYNPDDMPLPENFRSEHPFDNGDMRLRDEQLAPWPRTPQIVQQHLADYYGMISHMDHQIGRILEALSRQGFLEDTIIVYTADHGLAVGQHGLLGKQNMYDHSVRIPMIFKSPGVPQGVQLDALTQSYDLFPTLCDLADVPLPPSVDGQSLRPLLNNEAAQIRPYICSVYKDVQRMISNGEWKLIRYYRGANGAGTNRLQLFHLAEDPWETQDLSAEASEQTRVRQMAADLAAWQRTVADPLVDRPVLL